MALYPRLLSKALFILLIPAMARMMVSCCDCPEPAVYNYSNCAVQTTVLDKSYEAPFETVSDTVKKEAPGLRIKIIQTQSTCSLNNHSFFFVAAYGGYCFCIKEKFVPRETLKNIRFSRANQFDAGHPAGSDITAYFQVVSNHNINRVGEDVSDKPITLINQELRFSEFDVFLITTPTDTGSYRFDVNLELSDGRVLHNTIRAVELT